MGITIKELFDKAENGTLTYEQFESAVKESGAKFADLSDGRYVSKSKYEADLKAKDGELEAKDTEIATRDEQIANLNTTITSRETDLSDLQKKLEEAGQDATKLAELNDQFAGLQQKYDNDVRDYQAKMQHQAYEFAVKEFANTKDFTSQAAKRDFIQSMIARNLEMEDGKILGREDFAEKYAAENEDAFYVEYTPDFDDEVAPEPESEPEPAPVVPQFVAPTPGPEPSSDDSGFHFNFTGVRPVD